MSDKNNDKNSYSFPEACTYLGMSRKTLQKYVDNDEIASYPAGNRRRFTKEVLDRHMSGRGKGSASPAETNSEGAIDISPEIATLEKQKKDLTLKKEVRTLQEDLAKIEGRLLTSEEVIALRAKNAEDRQANEEAEQINEANAEKNKGLAIKLQELIKSVPEKERALGKREATVKRDEEYVKGRLKTAFEQSHALESERNTSEHWIGIVRNFNLHFSQLWDAYDVFKDKKAVKKYINELREVTKGVHLH